MPILKNKYEDHTSGADMTKTLAVTRITTITMPVLSVLLLSLLVSMLLFGCISIGSQAAGGSSSASPTAATNGTSNSGSSSISASSNGTSSSNGTGSSASNTVANNSSANSSNTSSSSSTNTATTAVPRSWERYISGDFSFEYPVNMVVQSSAGSSSGIFSGTNYASGQTNELLVVTYANTRLLYGANKDDLFKDNPTKTASDFLIQDRAKDSAGSLLSNAYEVGAISTFSVARYGMAAQQPFKIKFSGSNKTYSGYAINLYVPERSLHIKMRVVALDDAKAVEIRDNFLLSFRLEQ